MNSISINQDNELIIAIRLNNESASFEELFNKYRPLVNKATQRYHFRFLENEDLVQEARIVCYQASLAYDTTGNVSFGKFFQQSLFNRYCSLLRKESAKKRLGDRYAESFEYLFETQGDSFTKDNFFSPNSLGILITKEMVLSITENMSEFEYTIFNLLAFEHYTPERICLDLNLPRTKVNRAMSRCRTKMVNCFGNKK
ncbi:sigma-70 family RNA polymerase sigma factor [Liquorilactobacillus capillatus]|uniref:ComX n=1 Tax=Liquorilactobacillus capillatus DSM 19910 TaxID=1423731 RepID=A0A0R1M1J6_9LACO|nr:sigma-70 family RNA polymerase sigma factor [Liquorilactobacillus capillatus]KRL01790.1 ComX [Liquorilactobacillus capillatus DSM 19910]